MELFRTKLFPLKTSGISVVTTKNKLKKSSVKYLRLFWSLQFLPSVLLCFKFQYSVLSKSYIELSCGRLHLCPQTRRALIQFNKIFSFSFPKFHFNIFSNPALGEETRTTILSSYLYHVSFSLEINRMFCQQNTQTICNTVKKEKGVSIA